MIWVKTKETTKFSVQPYGFPPYADGTAIAQRRWTLPAVPRRSTVRVNSGQRPPRSGRTALPAGGLRTHPFYIAPASEYGALSALVLFVLLSSAVKYLHGEAFSVPLLRSAAALFLAVQLL